MRANLLHIAPKRFLLITLSTSIALFALGYSRTQLRKEFLSKQLIANSQPPLYLPEARYVRLVTLGFDKFASDLLWFNTINYFGKQLETSRDMPWFGQMCNLVSVLDPKARHVVEFCATLLSWVGRDPQSSRTLLERAIQNDPDYWRYHYLLGFTYWYFLSQKDLAATSLAKAANLPDAPIFLGSLASRLLATGDTPATAINFLKELIHRTSDEHAKKALEERLTQAYISRDIELLNERITKYHTTHGSLPLSFEDLIKDRLITRLPTDPFNMPYLLNPNTGEVSTSSGKHGLEFSGRSAQTGLAHKEWENKQHE